MNVAEHFTACAAHRDIHGYKAPPHNLSPIIMGCLILQMHKRTAGVRLKKNDKKHGAGGYITAAERQPNAAGYSTSLILPV